MTCDVILVGVGGQGILLASRVLGRLAMDAGLEIKVSEVHGMSQRGGSVITHVRMGVEVHSPLVEAGRADAVIGMERLETARALPYLKDGGLIVTSTLEMPTMTVLSGADTYPEHLDARMPGAVALDTRPFGRGANCALLGAFARRQGAFDKDAWVSALQSSVPPASYADNLRAFDAGWEAGA